MVLTVTDQVTCSGPANLDQERAKRHAIERSRLQIILREHRDEGKLENGGRLRSKSGVRRFVDRAGLSLRDRADAKRRASRNC